MIGSDWPKRGTPEFEWWSRGATAEQELSVEGMTRDGLEVYECVQTLAQQGRSRAAIAEWTCVVFTADWSLRERLRLALRLVVGR